MISTLIIYYTYELTVARSTHRKSSMKKMFLKMSQNLQKKKDCTKSLFKKETLAQVFSSEFREIFMNTFFIEQFRWLLLDMNSEKISSQIAKPIIDLTRSSNTDSNEVTISFITSTTKQMMSIIDYGICVMIETFLRANICLFKFINKKTRKKCDDVNDVVLVFLLLTLNIFHKFF